MGNRATVVIKLSSCPGSIATLFNQSFEIASHSMQKPCSQPHVLELQDAIPVGYWVQFDPLKLPLLLILWNMGSAPAIVLYIEMLTSSLLTKSPVVSAYIICCCSLSWGRRLVSCNDCIVVWHSLLEHNFCIFLELL